MPLLPQITFLFFVHTMDACKFATIQGATNNNSLFEERYQIASHFIYVSRDYNSALAASIKPVAFGQ